MNKRKRARRHPRYRPHLQSLESRRVLAAITVTSALDNLITDGQVTLREAILAAETNASVDGSTAGDPGADTIQFAPALSGVPIRLAGSLTVSESLLIQGDGADATVISAENLSRHFELSGSGDGGSNHYVMAGLTLENGRSVKANAADPDQFGGSILFNGSQEESLVLRDVVIGGSQADVGGAIHANGIKLHVDRSTITGNQANFGGGLTLQNVRAVITNSTINGNTASIVGGGIDHFGYDADNASTVDLINVTLTDNDAPNGRNLRNSSQDDGDAIVRYGNTIIFGGVGGQGFGNNVPSGNGLAATISLGNNLLDHKPGGVGDFDDRYLQGPQQAGFLPLTDNGGETPTQALHPLSMAVDGGNDLLAFGPGPDLLLGTADDVPFGSDQRGGVFSRILDGGSGSSTIDIGAFEVQEKLVVPQLVVSNVTDAAFRDVEVDANDLTLREAVAVANLQNGPNTVTFSPQTHGQTISLAGLSIVVPESVTIVGPGADLLTISGSNQTRIFTFGNDDGDAGQTFDVRGLTLTEGSSNAGGAIWLGNNELFVRDTLFKDNNAAFGGGLLSHTADVHLLSTSFVNNHATQNGGGAHINDSQGSIVNTTFSGNVAEGTGGGGLWARAAGVIGISDFPVINSTFVNNTADQGANVYATAVDSASKSELRIGNSIFVSDNPGGDSSLTTQADSIANIVSLGNNIASQDFLDSPQATDRVNTDPQLGSLQTLSSGLAGFTPLVTSPALDSGNTQLLPADDFDVDGDADTTESFPFDAAGNLRVVDLPGLAGTVDVGAVEVPAGLYQTFDYGDAPDPSYATLLQSDGPRHRIDDLFLGSIVDDEINGQPTSGADGDSSDDGVTFLTSLVSHPTEITTAAIEVTASKAGRLDGWLDFSGDGDWIDSGEQVFSSQDVVAGTQILTFPVPAGFQPKSTFARFRLSAAGGLLPNAGTIDGGEVEDYAIDLVDGSGNVNINVPDDSTYSFITSAENLVVAADTQLIFSVPAANVTGLSFVGTAGDDVIRLADLSGQKGDQIPIIVDGQSGTDRWQLATIFDYVIDSRITLESVEAQLPRAGFDSTSTLTPALADEAKGDAAALTLVVDTTDPIVPEDGWQYAVSEVLTDGFARRINAGTTEVAIIGGGDWTNPIARYDVDARNGVTALDALVILNHLASKLYLKPNTNEFIDAGSAGPFPDLFFDTTGEGKATGLDALRVINEIARQQLAGENEQVVAALPANRGQATDVNATRQWSLDPEPTTTSKGRELSQETLIGAGNAAIRPMSVNSTDREAEVDQAMRELDDFVDLLG